MNITVIGLGYVGLVTAVSFANMGYRVHGIDINKLNVAKINAGKSPVYEKGVNELLMKLLNKSLFVHSNYSNNELLESNVIFLCLPTPPKKSGEPDDSFLMKACKELLKKKFINLNSILIKSTVSPGTNASINKSFIAGGLNVPIISNPEFLREGSAIHDFNYPDRIIAGIREPNEKNLVETIYRPLNRRKNKIIFTSPEEAEITKYASNAMLASKISFMNEISRICDVTNSNINNVRMGMGADHRIGPDFLYAGLGYGGSCFPKDIKALKWYKKRYGLKVGIIEATEKINQDQFLRALKKIQSFYGRSLSKKNITFLGLSFKPETDDVRESPAIKLLEVLAPYVRQITAYDPQAITKAKKIIKAKNIKYVKTKKLALAKTHAVVIATEWKEFWNFEVSELELIQDKVIFDTRNILSKENLQKVGIKHIGLGS